MEISDLVRAVADHGTPAAEIVAALPIVAVSHISTDVKATIINSLLSDERREVRFAALGAAGRMGDQRTIQFLRDTLVAEANKQFRRRALVSLASLLGPDDLASLLHAQLEGADVDWRICILGAARGLPRSEFITFTTRFLDSDDVAVVRLEAALSLAFIGIDDGADLIVSDFENLRAAGRTVCDYIDDLCALTTIRYQPALRHLRDLLLSADALSEEARCCVFGGIVVHLAFAPGNFDAVFDKCRRWLESLTGSEPRGPVP